jgi:hypothetical protein
MGKVGECAGVDVGSAGHALKTSVTGGQFPRSGAVQNIQQQFRDAALETRAAVISITRESHER